MDLIAVIFVIYLGGPIGVLCVLIGLFGLRGNATKGPRDWPAITIVIGVLCLIAAAMGMAAIANTNFGL